MKIVFNTDKGGKFTREPPQQLERALRKSGVNPNKAGQEYIPVFEPTIEKIGQLFTALALIGGHEMVEPLDAVDMAIRNAAEEAIFKLKQQQ